MKAWVTNKGRRQVWFEGRQVLYSHVVWNRSNPDDPVKPGEVIHHKNGNSLDDRVENYQKMTKAEHDELHTPERVRGIRKAIAGVPRPDHVKKKIGDANRGRPLSDEHKAAISRLGTKHSESTKEKMRLSQKRRREAEFLC